MDVACSTHVIDKRIQGFGRKTSGKRQQGRPKRRL